MDKVYTYRFLGWLAQIFSMIFIFIALLCLLPYVAKYLMTGGLAPYVHKALNWEADIRAFVKSLIPTKVAGFDLARFIVLVCSLFATATLSDISQRYRYKITYQRLRQEMADITFKRQGVENIQGGAEKVQLFEKKMAEVQASGSRKGRETLLKELVAIKQELDSFGRDLAFLSIDVVGSTKMKEGEDQMMVEYDFDQYRQLVESKLMSNGCIKFAWTGDGLMSCFNTIQAAISAGKDLIEGLTSFNSNKHIKTDFAVRCGVNAGYIYFDESKPLDQITDRTIDIAGHMQKYAGVNSICVAKGIVDPVDNSVEFAPTNRLVDGYETYEWRHK